MTLATGRMDIALEAALALAARKDWEDVSLAEIAREAGKTLADFYGEIDKEGLVDELDKRLDKACASEPIEQDASLRERLFDVAMLRFEEMEKHRDALLSIRGSWKFNPVDRLKAAGRRTRTARWMLTCAEEDGAGLGARSVLLSGILFRAEEAWEKETSPDFTRTMAQLDRDLRDVGGFVQSMRDVMKGDFSNFGRPKKKEKSADQA